MFNFDINDSSYGHIEGMMMDIEEFASLLGDTLNRVILVRRTAELNGFLDNQEYINFEDAVNVISTLDLPDKY